MQNYAAFHFLPSRWEGTPTGSFLENEAGEIEPFAFFNHSLMLYPVILVFEADESVMPNTLKEELAKIIIGDYYKKMVSCDGAGNECYGPGKENVLFAISTWIKLSNIYFGFFFRHTLLESLALT